MAVLLPEAATNVNLLIDWSSSDARLVFHVYIFLVIVLIKVFGDQCCAIYAQVRVLGHRHINLHYMTGWLSDFDLLKSIWSLRALPGGWLFGFTMLLASGLFVADTLLVATLIRTEVVQARCPFGTGMVVSTASPAPHTISRETLTVPANGSPAVVAGQAQTISLANGGLAGIYKRVNRNLNFSAQPEDVYGGWSCTVLPTEVILPYTASPSAVAQQLLSQGLMYDSFDAIKGCDSEYQPNLYSHVVIMASSIALEGFLPFDIRISVDVESSIYDSKKMQTYECKATGDGVDGILKSMWSYGSLDQWCSSIQGSLYNGKNTPASSEAPSLIEQSLNSMAMVAGGGNYLLNTTATDETLGCVLPRVTISWAVIAVASATTVLLLLLLVCWLVLCIWRSTRERKALKDIEMRNNAQADEIEMMFDAIKSDTPSSLLGWMAHATSEAKAHHAMNTTVKSKRLKTFTYGQTHDTPTFGVLVSHANGEKEPSVAAPSISPRILDETVPSSPSLRSHPQRQSDGSDALHARKSQPDGNSDTP